MAIDDRVAKVNELEQHTSRMAQVIQQMECRFHIQSLLNSPNVNLNEFSCLF